MPAINHHPIDDGANFKSVKYPKHPYSTQSLQLIDTVALSKLSGISESSIRKACGGFGKGKVTVPRITRIGALIRFRLDHVQEWLDSLSGIDSKLERHALCQIDQDPESKRRTGRPRNAGGQK